MKKNKKKEIDLNTRKVCLIVFLVVFVIVLLLVVFFGISLIDEVEEENKLDNNVQEVEVPKHVEGDIVASGEKINIYLFWGDGCSYCNDLKAFMASIEDEYGKYYNLYTFEVWRDTDNKAFMDKMAAAKGDELRGVPYMIIGSDSFKGYSSSLDTRIIASIKAQYERSDRYDVYEHIED